LELGRETCRCGPWLVESGEWGKRGKGPALCFLLFEEKGRRGGGFERFVRRRSWPVVRRRDRPEGSSKDFSSRGGKGGKAIEQRSPSSSRFFMVEGIWKKTEELHLPRRAKRGKSMGPRTPLGCAELRVPAGKEAPCYARPFSLRREEEREGGKRRRIRRDLRRQDAAKEGSTREPSLVRGRKTGKSSGVAVRPATSMGGGEREKIRPMATSSSKNNSQTPRGQMAGYPGRHRRPGKKKRERKTTSVCRTFLERRGGRQTPSSLALGDSEALIPTSRTANGGKKEKQNAHPYALNEQGRGTPRGRPDLLACALRPPMKVELKKKRKRGRGSFFIFLRWRRGNRETIRCEQPVGVRPLRQRAGKGGRAASSSGKKWGEKG